MSAKIIVLSHMVDMYEFIGKSPTYFRIAATD